MEIKKITQKEFRQNFWSYLKETNYNQYKKSFKSRRQNNQPTDTRISFTDYLDNEFRNGNITDKQSNKFTL